MKDGNLKDQALSSLQLKKFHAQGGSVYALYPGADTESAVKFIVSLQTISDYLDNLCDRCGVIDESAFRQLHIAVSDSLKPYSKISDYYKYYPYKDDNGYLQGLVQECRNCIIRLPSFKLIAEPLEKYAELYSELQVLKHLSTDIRETRLKEWASSHLAVYPDIFWWEFSAAAGSTLGIFVLFAASFDQKLSPASIMQINDAYFPWICGFHILLDYFIDLNEDLNNGDLNFTYYYDNLKHCEERLIFFLRRSIESCLKLPNPKFHLSVIYGLIAMYLTDPKASQGMNRLISTAVLKAANSNAVTYYRLCKLLRSIKKL